MKVYTDTSVIGGYFDKEFQEWSIALWNEFIAGTKHIVNLDRIRLYNSINLRFGYRLIEIRTPREILNLSDNE